MVPSSVGIFHIVRPKLTWVEKIAILTLKNASVKINHVLNLTKARCADIIFL